MQRVLTLHDGRLGPRDLNLRVTRRLVAWPDCAATAAACAFATDGRDGHGGGSALGLLAGACAVLLLPQAPAGDDGALRRSGGRRARLLAAAALAGGRGLALLASRRRELQAALDDRLDPRWRAAR